MATESWESEDLPSEPPEQRRGPALDQPFLDETEPAGPVADTSTATIPAGTTSPASALWASAVDDANLPTSPVDAVDPGRFRATTPLDPSTVATPSSTTQPLPTSGGAGSPLVPPVLSGGNVSTAAPPSIPAPPSVPPLAVPPSVPSPAFGPAPSSPPPRFRPDPAASLAVPAAPAAATDPTAPDETSAPVVKPAPGWGWRALVAFVAGGVLTGGGFAFGQLSGSDEAATATDAGATTPVTAEAPTTAPDTQAPATTSPRPPDSEAGDAAFVAKALGPSVVQIETPLGIGSGVVYDDGLILTNHHVIEGTTDLVVQLSDGRRLRGSVLGSEPNVDIAVVSVGEGNDLPIAPLATDERPQVGQVAIAIGSPFRLQQTVTEGIVSAVDRPVPTGSVYTAMIQTDAPINPGNSGGALADRDGRVIGINTAIQTDGNSNTNAGIGFAIPIDTAVSVADRIVAGVPIEAGFLGVAGDQAVDGSAGVEVTNVTAGSAADDAGLQVGDLILSIDGAPVTAFEELAGLVVAQRPGDVVALEVVRNGQPLTIEATLGAREE